MPAGTARGVLYVAGSGILWGLLPFYWKELEGTPALEILAHRIAWSLVFIVLLLSVLGRWAWLRPTLRRRRVLVVCVLSAGLLATNWYLYIWAVNAGHIVETSLGYFINPLVSVLLGICFLRERLRPVQGAALALATAGVLYLTYSHDALPWISLGLAFSFGTYGLLRKIAPLDSLEGLAVESAVLFPAALAYLVVLQAGGGAAFANSSVETTLLLVGAGLATTSPLLLFAAGVRLTTMTTLGFLQYLNPTMQFLIGAFAYDEPVSAERLTGFCIIWLALAVFTVEQTRLVRKARGFRYTDAHPHSEAAVLREEP